MYLQLPLEFYVVGTPVSVQGKRPEARREWKSTVELRARETAGPDAWNIQDKRLSVTLLYFPQAPMEGDLDNIIKLTIDALAPAIMRDDSLIDRIFAQRFAPGLAVSFSEPSEVLLEAYNIDDPVLYIRVSELQLTGIAP
jgi:crossover junction endodeoxyribonuclease RusA